MPLQLGINVFSNYDDQCVKLFYNSIESKSYDYVHKLYHRRYTVGSDYIVNKNYYDNDEQLWIMIGKFVFGS